MVHLLGISVPGFSVWCDTTVPRCCSEESWAAPAHTENSICTRHETTRHLYSDLLWFLTWNLELDRPFHYSSFTLLLEEYNLFSYLHCQGGFKWEVRFRPSIFWWFLCVLMTDEQLDAVAFNQAPEHPFIAVNSQQSLPDLLQISHGRIKQSKARCVSELLCSFIW